MRTPVKARLAEHFKRIRDEAIPHLTSSTVLFSYIDEQIKVLLIEFIGMNGLLQIPERAIFNEETLEESARKVLSELLDLHNYSIDQFHTFDIRRSDRKIPLEIINYLKQFLEKEDIDLIRQREIIIGHYALINNRKLKIQRNFPVRKAEWHNTDELDSLHLEPFQKEIILKAKQNLKQTLFHSSTLQHLLPEIFTLAEMQKLIEVILDKKMDRGNFRKKIISMGKLVQVGTKASKNHRSPFLYSFAENYI